MAIDRRLFLKGSGAALGGGALVSGCTSNDIALTAAPVELTAPYDQPFTDIDEWRDEPVRHRYVHGGFEGTDLLFSMYFPPEDEYEGRFFQPLAATSGSENTAPMSMQRAYGIGYATTSGAYLIESNQGAKNMFGGSSEANVAVAQYSRMLAADMYGPHRPFGYVYGGSGGAFKTLSCVENHPGVWDGSVPFVHGSPVAIPYVFTVQAQAMRVLGKKLPAVADALAPGGSGDIYAGLNQEEREALKEVTGMGFPPRAWFNYETIAFGYTGVFTSLIDFIVNGDPEYFDDFWTKPGYLGANPTQSLLDARVQYPTKIASLIMPEEARSLGLPMTMSASQTASGVEFPAALRMDGLPTKDLRGASVVIKSGGAKGAVLYVAGQQGNILMTGFGASSFMALPKLRPGDEVDVDNSVYLASQTYHRHQMQDPEFYIWDQFRDADGQPIYPQRPKGLNESGNRAGDNSSMSGEFHGKMIVMQALMDEAAYPWQADWFKNRIKKAQGMNFDDKYRLYFVDNTMHTTQISKPGDPAPVKEATVISYQGVLQQTVLELTQWVEKGKAPPESTQYSFENGQIIPEATAAKRKGLQPLVTLTANGGEKADVKVGEAVSFSAKIEVAPGTGVVKWAQWDFDGYGKFPVSSEFDEAEAVTVTETYTFDKPGTYFPSLKVASGRAANQTAYACPENLGRVRVVVS